MASQDLARRAETAAAQYTAADDEHLPAEVHWWRMICEQAEVLAKAGDSVPKAFQGSAPKIVAAALAGRTFGWDVMTSMRMGHVIGGGYRLNSEAQGALIRGAGHDLDIIRHDDGSVSVVGTRKDGRTYTATWDEARARRMKLWDGWVAAGRTEYMLVHRAVAEVGRFLFPDLMLGMATDEDIEGAVSDTASRPGPAAPAGSPEPAQDTAPPTPTEEPVDADIVDDNDGQRDLFGDPATPPTTTPPWAEWGRAEWANHCAGRLALPEISRTWKLRNFDAVTNADDATKAAIYDAADSA